MSNSPKLFVIGTSFRDVHRWSTANGIPWSRVEPVTEPHQLRVRPGQDSVTYAWADTSKMLQSVKLAIRTQLSIRRCLGHTFDTTGLYGARELTASQILHLR